MSNVESGLVMFFRKSVHRTHAVLLSLRSPLTSFGFSAKLLSKGYAQVFCISILFPGKGTDIIEENRPLNTADAPN